MNTVLKTGIEELVSEFKELYRHDRKAILKKLPKDTRAELERVLEIEDLNDTEEPVASNADQRFAPWITSCLDSDKRTGFSALRNNFRMTEHAEQSLRNALGLPIIDDTTTAPAGIVPSRETGDDIKNSDHHSPTLMNRMGDFLNRKVMSQ